MSMTKKSERPFSFYFRDKEKVRKEVRDEEVWILINKGYILIIYYLNIELISNFCKSSALILKREHIRTNVRRWRIIEVG